MGTGSDQVHVLFQTDSMRVATLETVLHPSSTDPTAANTFRFKLLPVGLKPVAPISNRRDRAEFDGCPGSTNRRAHGRPMLPSERLVSLIPSEC